MDPNTFQLQSQPVKPEPQSLSLAKIVTLIALLVLVLVVAVYGGAMWQKGQGKAIVADETSTWQTYRNEEYGFGLKYPNNLTLTENFVKNYDPEPENPDNKIFDYLNLTLAAPDRQQFTFNLYVNHPGIGLEGGRVVSRSVIVLDNVTAEKEVNEIVEGHEQGYKFTTYSFKRATDWYMVVTPFNELSDQIMSSLRFTK